MPACTTVGDTGAEGATLTRLMIVVGSVRDGRIGLTIAEWVRDTVEHDDRFELDWADLKEIDLPLMTEPNHPRLRQYTQQPTIEWSDRVDAADAFIFVQPEYNYSYSPALKKALDHLSQEWWRKPLGTVSYGGISGGLRSAQALKLLVTALKMVPIPEGVVLSAFAKQTEGGVFAPSPANDEAAKLVVGELHRWAGALATLR